MMLVQSVTVAAAGVELIGDLTVPHDANGVVAFAHGSGSSRASPRNRRVARALNDAGLGTLLMDLLTPAEEQAEAATAHLRFDIALLASRLVEAIAWLRAQPATGALPLGLFGASTGAAAALVAAARAPEGVAAIVSRGGRPDLAGHALAAVHAPTRLIVGGDDREVLALNRLALERLTCEKDLVVVRRAGHLFEEPGALAQVARLAVEWFAGRMAPMAG